jgi:hypothetical protein
MRPRALFMESLGEPFALALGSQLESISEALNGFLERMLS